MDPSNYSLPPAGLSPRSQEQALLEVLPRLHGQRILCNTAGRAQLASALADRLPSASIDCHFLDLYHLLETEVLLPSRPDRLHLVCTADIPEGPFDVAAFAFSQHGEAELTRDLMHSAYRNLSGGGRLAVSSDNASDNWLHMEMRKLFSHVTRCKVSSGVVYLASKESPLRKTKNFRCELAFRDHERLIRLVTRPGVFAHRRIDSGARHLLQIMHVRSGMHVLDLGCGSGAVSLAAAMRDKDVHVVGIDSNPRAIECLSIGAALNGLTNVQTHLDADGHSVEPGRFDLVLANPPYYSRNRISEIFLQTAHRALRPAGIVHFVTKAPQWYIERLPDLFTDVHVDQLKDYALITATKPS